MVTVLVLLSLSNFLILTYLIYLLYHKYHLFNSKPVDSAPNTLSPSGVKIGLTRYNPFDDLGGDQSFILCLLDNQNSGAIITSLHSRHHTRVYAKPIKNGQTSGVTFSPEEKQTLTSTLNHHDPKN